MHNPLSGLTLRRSNTAEPALQSKKSKESRRSKRRLTLISSRKSSNTSCPNLNILLDDLEEFQTETPMGSCRNFQYPTKEKNEDTKKRPSLSNEGHQKLLSSLRNINIHGDVKPDPKPKEATKKRTSITKKSKSLSNEGHQKLLASLSNISIEQRPPTREQSIRFMNMRRQSSCKLNLHDSCPNLDFSFGPDDE